MTGRKQKAYTRDLARQRINWLLDLADQIHSVEPQLADRYVQLAMKIAKKARIHYPPRLKARACRRCGAYLAPGITAQVRITSDGGTKYIVVKCLKCGYERRYPLRGNKKAEGAPWRALYQATQRTARPEKNILADDNHRLGASRGARVRSKGVDC